MFGLTQHVTKPTHSRGHTLDVLISKGVVISNVDVIDVALSDHFCVFFHHTTLFHTRVVTAVFDDFRKITLPCSTQSLVEHTQSHTELDLTFQGKQ